jgi:hypothetical protein
MYDLRFPRRWLWWLSSSRRWHRVALIRTDVSSTSRCLYKSLLLRAVTCSHSCTLKMEAIRSSETSVLIRATRCHLPEDDNHQIVKDFTHLPPISTEIFTERCCSGSSKYALLFFHEVPEEISIIWIVKILILRSFWDNSFLFTVVVSSRYILENAIKCPNLFHQYFRTQI